MTEVLRAGWQSKLYYKDTTWKEVKLAQDVDHDDSPDQLEASTRADGIKRYYPGQAEGKISFKLLAIQGEASYVFLKAAALAKAPVELAWTDGDDIATVDTVYGRDWFMLTWKRGEPINGMPTIDIEAAPTIKLVSGAVVTRSYDTTP